MKAIRVPTFPRISFFRESIFVALMSFLVSGGVWAQPENPPPDPSTGLKVIHVAPPRDTTFAPTVQDSIPVPEVANPIPALPDTNLVRPPVEPPTTGPQLLCTVGYELANLPGRIRIAHARRWDEDRADYAESEELADNNIAVNLSGPPSDAPKPVFYSVLPPASLPGNPIDIFILPVAPKTLAPTQTKWMAPAVNIRIGHVKELDTGGLPIYAIEDRVRSFESSSFTSTVYSAATFVEIDTTLSNRVQVNLYSLNAKLSRIQVTCRIQ
ncbi:MAG: hypothetical protein V1798_10510 [Pseudomonadota bacterium]